MGFAYLSKDYKYNTQIRYRAISYSLISFYADASALKFDNDSSLPIPVSTTFYI